MLEGFISLAQKSLHIQIPVKEVPPTMEGLEGGNDTWQLRISFILQLQEGGGACIAKNGDAYKNFDVVGAFMLRCCSS